MAILKIKDENGNEIPIPAIRGKSAYSYAKDGGYAGTEEEFAGDLAKVGELSEKIDNSSNADKEHTHSWNDLEDRPFGETGEFEYAEFITDLTVTEQSVVLQNMPVIEYDTIYKVVIDEKEYICTAEPVFFVSDNIPCIGNNDYFNTYQWDENKPPFYMGSFYNTLIIGTAGKSDSSAYHISVFKRKPVIKLLDRVYIADYLVGHKSETKSFVYDDKTYNSQAGAEIFNTQDNIAIGACSHAEGQTTLALADCSHAEGMFTKAIGEHSHAEGYATEAIGFSSHAEGEDTEASGRHSHAEGFRTFATGIDAHAEGECTIAASNYQHVQGKYNVEDTAVTYAHIVGNGSNTARSNAHTLDWSGNAWFQGDVYVGGTGQDDTAAKKLMVEPTADDALALLAEVGMIDPIVDANGAVYIEDDNVIYTL